MIEPRFYREQMGKDRFTHFTIGYKDSDLWIGIDPPSYTNSIPAFAQEQLVLLRQELENYILSHPEFSFSFEPVQVPQKAPEIAKTMANAAEIAGTGPMAAVAGAFAEFIGKAIQKEFGVREIVVENGGDIYLAVTNDLIFSVYAGKSDLTGKIGIEIKAAETPLGICTSAGTVGPSISFGKADAVVVISKNCSVADAFATAIGNNIKHYTDIAIALKEVKNNPEIEFLIAICEGRVGLQGNFAICPLK